MLSSRRLPIIFSSSVFAGKERFKSRSNDKDDETKYTPHYLQ
jgi:hypothetical protein